MSLAIKLREKHGIRRFCHSTEDMVKDSYIYNKIKTSDSNELYEIIKKISNSNLAYIISLDEGIDGTERELFEAIDLCLEYGMPSIIIVEENVSIIITEQEVGNSEKYILYFKL